MSTGQVVLYGLKPDAGKITAIKCVRQIAKVVLGDEYHFGLKEAKAAVDGLEQGIPLDFVCEKKYEMLLKAYCQESGIRVQPEATFRKSLESYCKVIATDDQGYQYNPEYDGYSPSDEDAYGTSSDKYDWEDNIVQ